MIRKIIVAAMVAGTLGSAAAPAVAAVFVEIAPPAPRFERAPAPRRGWIWAPGHWEWAKRHYVWVRGAWLRERPGYRYDVPVWVQRDGRWLSQGGGWTQGDRDHDGIPNRFDRDRDGDRVRNRDDRRPDNPRRN